MALSLSSWKKSAFQYHWSPGRVEAVEEALQHGERDLSREVHERRRELPDGLEDLCGLREVARVAPGDHRHLLHVVLGREHRNRGNRREAEPPVEVLGGLEDEVAPEAEHLGPLVHRPEDRPAVDGADRVGAEEERGHDPEVAAAAPHGPEEIRVLLGAGRDQAAVREDHVDPEEVVDGQAVLAAEVADPAAQGEAPHARRREEPARHGEVERVGRVVHVAPEAAPFDPHGPVLLVHPDSLQPRQVDHEPPVADAETRTVVPTPAHREEQLLLAGEGDARHHVRHVRAPRDQRGPLVDHAVVDLPSGIVGRVARGDQLAAKPRAQLLDLRLAHRSSSCPLRRAPREWAAPAPVYGARTTWARSETSVQTTSSISSGPCFRFFMAWATSPPARTKSRLVSFIERWEVVRSGPR